MIVFLQKTTNSFLEAETFAPKQVFFGNITIIPSNKLKIERFRLATIWVQTSAD